MRASVKQPTGMSWATGRTAAMPIREVLVRGGAGRERVTMAELDVARMIPAAAGPLCHSAALVAVAGKTGLGLAVPAGQWVSDAAQGSVLAGAAAAQCAMASDRENLPTVLDLADRVASARSDSVADRLRVVSMECVRAMVRAAVVDRIGADRSGLRLVRRAASRASAQEVLAGRRASVAAVGLMDRKDSAAPAASMDSAVSRVRALMARVGMEPALDPDLVLPASKAHRVLATVLAVEMVVVDRRAASAAMAAALDRTVPEVSADGARTGHQARRAEWVAGQVAMTDVVLATDSRDVATSAMKATTMVRRPMSTPIVVRKSLGLTIPHGTVIEGR
jgi:hypothetical protein